VYTWHATPQSSVAIQKDNKAPARAVTATKPSLPLADLGLSCILAACIGMPNPLAAVFSSSSLLECLPLHRSRPTEMLAQHLGFLYLGDNLLAIARIPLFTCQMEQIGGRMAFLFSSCVGHSALETCVFAVESAAGRSPDMYFTILCLDLVPELNPSPTRFPWCVIICLPVKLIEAPLWRQNGGEGVADRTDPGLPPVTTASIGSAACTRRIKEFGSVGPHWNLACRRNSCPCLWPGIALRSRRPKAERHPLEVQLRQCCVQPQARRASETGSDDIAGVGCCRLSGSSSTM
jgi:hypothetical protein